MKNRHIIQSAGYLSYQYIDKSQEKRYEITWCFIEGESVDDHFSLNREEKSTSIWTPTSRLQYTSRLYSKYLLF